MLSTQFLHERLHFGQVVAGELREQMVFNLVLQSTVEPVFVPRAFHISRGAQLKLKKTNSGLLLRGEYFRSQVRDQQLHVQHAAEEVGDEREQQANAPAREQGHTREKTQKMQGKAHAIPLLHATRGEDEDVEKRFELVVYATEQGSQGKQGVVLDLNGLST